MKKLLFVYNHEYPEKWKDGLWAAIDSLQFEYHLTNINLAREKLMGDMSEFNNYDFILGWGGFNSSVDQALQLMKQLSTVKAKFGLCLAGNAFPLRNQKYDVIFYETE